MNQSFKLKELAFQFLRLMVISYIFIMSIIGLSLLFDHYFPQGLWGKNYLSSIDTQLELQECWKEVSVAESEFLTTGTSESWNSWKEIDSLCRELESLVIPR